MRLFATSRVEASDQRRALAGGQADNLTALVGPQVEDPGIGLRQELGQVLLPRSSGEGSLSGHRQATKK